MIQSLSEANVLGWTDLEALARLFDYALANLNAANLVQPFCTCARSIRAQFVI